MLTRRVIPCLLLSNGGLVKTTKFSKPQYVGDPINAVRIFNEKEVDELILLDIDASKMGRGPDFGMIEQIAGECFMPVCYGGGVRSADEARTLFKLGVEKVALQSALMRDPAILREIADFAGEQAVVAAIDIKRNWLGKPKLYNGAGVPARHGDWQEALAEAIAFGAGEIMLNCVDRDGTRAGIDADLIREASAAASVPLIAMGGVGSKGDIVAAAEAGASAIAAGAFFVFHGPHRAVLITYPTPAELKEMWAQA
jgi:cyclase